MLCKEDDCERTATMRQMCDKHYQVWYRAWKKEQAALGYVPSTTPLDLDFTQAACVDADPDIFFSLNEDANERYDRKGLKLAKQLCSICPIQEACLKYAIDNDLQGVWGGMTRRERFAKVAVRPERVLSDKARETMRLNNQKRTLAANTRDLELYKRALEQYSSAFPDRTIQILEVRVEHPELSPAQIGEELGIPLSRDVINGTLRRVKAYVKDQTNE